MWRSLLCMCCVLYVGCSTMVGAGLNTTNCMTNKSKPLYIAAISACPN